LVATYAGQAVGWYEAGQGAGWIGSIVGAFVLLWIYEKFQSRRAAA
ncbi:MAG TPA: GlsB/YeaQ/YmgE family stress response membrane protein, partial [Candidatus Eisenbacteria bacterium]|nr:GlsB/YeaQ/YmgE family stress response membrane protein [Candidatus Eisenbacteria bacterium]